MITGRNSVLIVMIVLSNVVKYGFIKDIFNDFVFYNYFIQFGRQYLFC